MKEDQEIMQYALKKRLIIKDATDILVLHYQGAKTFQPYQLFTLIMHSASLPDDSNSLMKDYGIQALMVRLLICIFLR